MYRLTVEIENIDHLQKAVKILQALSIDKLKYEQVEKFNFSDLELQRERNIENLKKRLPKDVEIEWAETGTSVKNLAGTFPDFPDVEELRRKSWGKSYTK
ncbi:MAG: hypothetical protein AAF741_03650 [Bacteroidota bacterium]